LQTPDIAELIEWSQKMLEKMRTLPQLADASRQQRLDERSDRRVVLAQRDEILPVGERAADLATGLVRPRQLCRHVVELTTQRPTVGLGLGARLLEQRTWKDDGNERVAMHVVVRA
jgi:hypothetical protein